MEDAEDRVIDRQPHQIATKLLALRQVVRESLPPYLTHDPAPDILLLLFVADAEKRHLSRDEIMEKTGLNSSAVSRWLAALAHVRLIKETGYLVGLSKAGIDCVDGIIAKVSF